jgi:membrane protein implicated in regulation of membrane protease activity
MTATRHNPFDLFSDKASRLVRGILAAVIAVAFLALVFFLAATLMAAFFVLAGAAVLAGGAFWLWRKVRGRKNNDGPEILVARRGPKGWTVDDAEDFGR